MSVLLIDSTHRPTQHDFERNRGEQNSMGECCFFKRERECELEREREGPLCPPETRKGIELICWCLVSAYGALNSRDS